MALWKTSEYVKSAGHGNRGHHLEGDLARSDAWKAMIKLILEGKNLIDIAKATGYSSATVRKWNRNPEFEAQLAATRRKLLGGDVASRVHQRKQERVEELIEQYATDAVRVINVNMRRSKNEHIQLAAAKDLAARSSRTSKTKKIQSTSLHAVLTPEMLASMARSAQQIQDYGHKVEAVELGPAEDDDLIVDDDQSTDVG